MDLVKQCLKFDATALAGMIAGAAMYINAADNPARMTLDTVNCRKHWMEAYNRARIFQVKFKLIYLDGLKENFQCSIIKTTTLISIVACNGSLLMARSHWAEYFLNAFRI